eukprot:11211726-Lingulodinium_polyedra.AAC.1
MTTRLVVKRGTGARLANNNIAAKTTANGLGEGLQTTAETKQNLNTCLQEAPCGGSRNRWTHATDCSGGAARAAATPS